MNSVLNHQGTLEAQIEDLKKAVIEMAGLVEKALETSTQGLKNQDLVLLSKVHNFENQINDLQIKIDELCLHVLAKQGPVAKDLRLILSIIKINTDLERMGDQCVNIAYVSQDLIERKLHNINLDSLKKMMAATLQMVKKSIDSFVKLDRQIAEIVLSMDDQIDQFKKDITDEQISIIKSNSSLTESCLDMIQVARNLERLGDHSTNIAEDVIFAATGKDIRHGGA